MVGRPNLKNKNITAKQIEINLANYFNYRQNLIVPNISWGLLDYEADLLVLNKSGYITEIEIKVSKQDLIRDAEKRHSHNSNLVKYLYFAIPDKLLPYIDYIPKKAGILVLSKNNDHYFEKFCWYLAVKKFREAEKNLHLIKVTDEKRYQLARLGAMRIWRLKKEIEMLKTIKLR